MIRRLLFGVSVFACCLGCTRETELQRSIFIEDPDYPGLPKYSEWGYNTFGVYCDRVAFTSKGNGVPAKLIIADGNGTFELEGTRQYTPTSSSGMRERLSILIPGLSAETYADLVSLHHQRIDLTETAVFLTIDGASHQAEVLEGELYFQRSQHLWVDGESMQVILSGLFSFKAVINNVPVTFQDGRFDVGIMEDNFYRY